MTQAAHTDSGFTLLELLVVLAIIGLVSGLAAVIAPQRLSGAQAARVQGELVVWLKAQQQAAMEGNEPIEVIAQDQQQLRSKDQLWQAPKASVIRLDPATLRFYPDGSASSGEIIVRSGVSDIRVRVHGLTGQVEAIK